MLNLYSCLKDVSFDSVRRKSPLLNCFILVLKKDFPPIRSVELSFVNF